MNTKIKIGEPHLYFKLKMWYKKYFINTENFLIVMIVLAVAGIVIHKFFQVNLQQKYAMTTIFFMATTVFLLMKNSGAKQ